MLKGTRLSFFQGPKFCKKFVRIPADSGGKGKGGSEPQTEHKKTWDKGREISTYLTHRPRDTF